MDMASFYKKIVAWLFVSLLRLWSLMTFAMAQRIGWLIGSILVFFNNDITRVTRRNIQACFPNLSDYHQRQLIKNSVRQACMTGSEMPAILFKPPEKLLNNVNRIYGQEIIQKCYKEGRGVMVLGPHLGCWEIGSMYYPRNYPAAMLYTPPKIKILDKLIYQARSRLCKAMSPANHSGIKMLFKAMANKEVVAMLTDQVPVDSAGNYIDFFGMPAKTMSFPGKLYQRFTPAVVVSYAVRNGIGKGLTLYIEDLEPKIIAAKAIDNITDPLAYAFTKKYEAIIRRFPEQYQWSYKRFKYHPEGVDIYSKEQ